MSKVSIVVIFCVLLSGCLSPGMRMEAPPMSTQVNASRYSIKPKFVAITTALIDQFKTFHTHQYNYTIGTHDIINVYVWNHPELGSPLGPTPNETGMNSNLSPTLSPSGYLVNTQGEIYFPLVGSIHVAGRTVEEIRSELTQRLTKYIRNPQIDVRVTGFRSKKFYVMGEVLKPNLFPLTDSPLSVTDAINLAGGLDPKTSDPSSIFVIRGDYAHPTVYWLNAHSPDALLLGQNFFLENHDVVFVSTAPVARWNRTIDQILPTIQTVWFTWSVTQNK